MKFTRIGVIAARLVADPAKLQAAANEAPRKGSDRPGTGEEDLPDLSLVALDGEGTGAQRDGKKAGAETPASDAQGSVRQTAGRGRKMRLVASLPVGRGLGTAQSARKRFPSAAVPRPILTVVGGLDHASSLSRTD